MPPHVRPMPTETDPYQHFSVAKEGRVQTVLDGIWYLNRLLPHLEKETLTPEDYNRTITLFQSIHDDMMAVYKDSMAGLLWLRKGNKTLPPKVVEKAEKAQIPAALKAKLEEFERYCSHAKATFDFQQQLLPRPKPVPQFA